MQNHYRELDVENFEDMQSKLIPYILSTYKNRFQFWNHLDHDKLMEAVPDLPDTLEKIIGQRPIQTYLLAVADFPEELLSQRLGANSLHADTSVESTRLNWPILNTTSIETKLFTSDAEPRTQILSSGEKYLLYKERDCKQVASFKMTKPTLLHVHTIHGLYKAEGPLPRYILSFKFDQDIAHLLN